MKILVCGDRDWKNKTRIEKILSEFTPTETTILHGCCRGADQLTDEVGINKGFSVKPFPANWEKYGKRAGPIRNSLMLQDEPDIVIAFHDHIIESRGTADTINKAKKKKIPVLLVTTFGRHWL